MYVHHPQGASCSWLAHNYAHMRAACYTCLTEFARVIDREKLQLDCMRTELKR